MDSATLPTTLFTHTPPSAQVHFHVLQPPRTDARDALSPFEPLMAELEVLPSLAAHLLLAACLSVCYPKLSAQWLGAVEQVESLPARRVEVRTTRAVPVSDHLHHLALLLPAAGMRL
jgi:hypothetical protein